MFPSKRVWAIEIGVNTLRVAALRRRREGARVEILDRARLHPEARLVAPARFRESALEVLREWRRRHHIRRRDPLAVVVPALRGGISTLHLPRIETERLAELVDVEVATLVRSAGASLTPGEEIAHAFVEEAGPTETTGRTLVAAWPRQLLASFLGLLADAGLQPDLVTFAPLADRAFLQYDHHQDTTSWHPDENIWILRIGSTLIDWSSSTFEGFFSVTRSCGIGRLEQLLEQETCLPQARVVQICEDLMRGIPPSVPTVEIALERYLEELLTILANESRQRRKDVSTQPARIVVLGRAGGLFGLARRLQRHFGVPVKPLTALHRIELRRGAFDPHLGEELGDFVPILGAGLALTWDTAPVVSLFSGGASKEIARGAMVRFLSAAVLLALCAALQWQRDRNRAIAPSPSTRRADQMACYAAGQERFRRFRTHLDALENEQRSRARIRMARYDLVSAWSRLPAAIEVRGQRWNCTGGQMRMEIELSLPSANGLSGLAALLGFAPPEIRPEQAPASTEPLLAEMILCLANGGARDAQGSRAAECFPELVLVDRPRISPHPTRPDHILLHLALRPRAAPPGGK